MRPAEGVRAFGRTDGVLLELGERRWTCIDSMSMPCNARLERAPWARLKTMGCFRVVDSSRSSDTVIFGPVPVVVAPLPRPRLASHF
jgi:hypothetical protein